MGKLSITAFSDSKRVVARKVLSKSATYITVRINFGQGRSIDVCADSRGDYGVILRTAEATTFRRSRDVLTASQPFRKSLMWDVLEKLEAAKEFLVEPPMKVRKPKIKEIKVCSGCKETVLKWEKVAGKILCVLCYKRLLKSLAVKQTSKKTGEE